MALGYTPVLTHHHPLYLSNPVEDDSLIFSSYNVLPLNVLFMLNMKLTQTQKMYLRVN